jgi:hypothetical protein
MNDVCPNKNFKNLSDYRKTRTESGCRSTRINQGYFQCMFPCGGGLEYPHRIPPSRRKRKGNSVPGGMTGHPVIGDINTETWSSRLGVRRKADGLGP